MPATRAEIEGILPLIRELHARVRASLLEACRTTAEEVLAEASDAQEGDTIYQIDKLSERELLGFWEPRARALGGLVLVAEGVRAGTCVLPEGMNEAAARFRLIVDPIDGTRGLMYQKRSGWILSAIAENRGPETRLSDVVLAVQTELPLLKQHLSDELWALRGAGVRAERYDRIGGTSEVIQPRPSRATSIAHGFASVVRFFPGVRGELGALDDEIALAALGVPAPGKALCFEDQYACTGGQLYELMSGHDRFIADLRPLFAPYFADRGLPLGLCCHPYDICTALIASELGVILTDGAGNSLDVPLDLETNVAWVGYANPSIRARIEPLLQDALRRRNLLV